MTNVSVFMSYRRGDAGWAGRIQNEIKRKQNVSVFRDVEDIHAGDNFPDRLQDELEKCDLVLVLVADTWVQRANAGDLAKNSDWVRKELLCALELQKPLLPLIVESNQIPSLPSDLTLVNCINACRLYDRSFNKDVGDLIDTIQKSVQKEQNRRITARLNGLRGVLRLAVRGLGKIKLPQEDDTKQIDQWLTPESFTERSNNLPAAFRNMGFEPAEVMHPDSLLPGVSYRAVRFKDRLRLQLGMLRHGEARPVLAIYEELIERNDTRLVITAFHEEISVYKNRFEILIGCLKEPESLDQSEYRLPYNSLFFCPIRSENTFRQTYHPRSVRDGIDSELFAKLFEMNWIGSRPLNGSDLHNFHDQLIRDFAEYEIIHAMEYPVQPRF